MESPQRLHLIPLIPPHLGVRAPPEDDAPLSITSVYADRPCHTLAMSVLHRIARNCSDVCKLHSNWWSFNMLKVAAEREAAACVAVEADMIWCATNAAERLPEAVRVWAGLWSAHRESEGALVALLRSPSDQAMAQSPAWIYLRWLAKAADLEFFSRNCGCDCRHPDKMPSPSASPEGWLSTASGRARSRFHWGLTE